ncbi:MAG: type II toxin-antitoxin system RelE/ParE family toxin [Algisphaera sp.]
MTKPKPIDYSDFAFKQLEEIADYIAAEGQPEAARMLLIRFTEVVDALSRFPLLGHQYESAHPRLQNIRVIGIPGYSVLIYHEVSDERVFINAVLAGSRGMSFIEGTIRRS